MSKWVRVTHLGREYIGKIDGETVRIHSGSMFSAPEATSQAIPLSAAKLLTPTLPGKMIALVDNYRELVAKLGHEIPEEPLYSFKGCNSFLAHGETIRSPRSYDGKVVYEGELGVVIGRRASGVPESDAARHIFGYTCVNDVTAIEIIAKDPEKWDPKTRETADHSIQYIVCAALQDGEVTMRTFEPGRFRRVDTLELLQRKTAGNLDEEERKLLESLLYEVRMRFVEVGRGAG